MSITRSVGFSDAWFPFSVLNFTTFLGWMAAVVPVVQPTSPKTLAEQMSQSIHETKNEWSTYGIQVHGCSHPSSCKVWIVALTCSSDVGYKVFPLRRFLGENLICRKLHCNLQNVRMGDQDRGTPPWSSVAAMKIWTSIAFPNLR